MTHICKWEVQSVSTSPGEDEGDYIDTTVRAVDADAAATEAVEDDWNGNGCEGDTDGVRKVGTEAWAERVVSGELTMDWTARTP